MNEFELRQHTKGYPSFTYAVINLCISCKQCNTSKKSFDPLADRAVAPAVLPVSSIDYAWVHPHLDPYSNSIKVTENWLYSWIDKKGEFTIRACKLDQSDVLARRLAADALASQSDDLKHFLWLLISRFDEIGHRDIRTTLCTRFGFSEKLAIKLVALWQDSPRDIFALESLIRNTHQLIGIELLDRQPSQYSGNPMNRPGTA